MTSKHRRPRGSQGVRRAGAPRPDPELWPPTGEPEPDYRQLEHDYRHSEAYAAMVRRYPVLERMIAACRRDALVADQRLPSPLAWDRSHGEG